MELGNCYLLISTDQSSQIRNQQVVRLTCPCGSFSSNELKRTLHPHLQEQQRRVRMLRNVSGVRSASHSLKAPMKVNALKKRPRPKSVTLQSRHIDCVAGKDKLLTLFY